jgi:hypothetical protein
MEGTSKSRASARSFVLIAVGIAIGLTITATPAGGHVGGTVTHLWQDHIRPPADARYANVVAGTDKAKNANKLDGLDSTELQPLTASVAAPLGFLAGGRGVEDVTRLATGVYTVEFNRSVGQCVRVASIGRELNFAGNPDFATTFVTGGSAGTMNGGGGVTVVTRNAAGTVVDLSFQLAVYC